MSNVIFDYGALEEAKSNAKKIVTGWNGIDDYKTGLNIGLKSCLDEWRLDKEEPYGHAYVSNAQADISDKIDQLEVVKTQWIDLSKTIDSFLKYVKAKDEKAVSIFKATSEQYTKKDSLAGFFNYIGDGLYGLFAVDLANCNGFTRTIADWGKKKMDDLSSVIQDANDWFRHGDGRYVLNIVGSAALTLAALAGTVIGFLGIPFTGGSSAVIIVGCVGTIASGVAAGISAYNSIYTIKENVNALSITDDPGTARFHGDVSKYSDYVKKTDFGSKEINEKEAKKAKTIDTVHAVAEGVSFVTSVATTFGTKKVVTGVDEFGDDIVKTSFDFSSSNVKKNVLKTFGFEVDSKKISADVVEINKTTVISNADEMGDTTIGIAHSTYEENYKSVAFGKTTNIAENGKKAVTKTATFNKANVSTEYGSIVASDNVVTQEFSMYTAHAETSSTVIDYTKAAKITPSKTLEAFQKASETPTLENKLKAAQSGFKFIGGSTSYLKASDDERTATVIQNIVKTNHLASQIDEYMLKVDISHDGNKYYIGGDATDKAVTLWKTITEPAA